MKKSLLLVFLLLLCTSCTSEKVPNSPFDQAQEIWDGLYGGYNTVGEIFTGGFIQFSDTDGTIINGSEYFISTDPNYRSTEDIRTIVEEVLTPKCADEEYYHWAFEGDTPLFKDYDHQLYILNAAGPTGVPLQKTIKGVTQNSADKFIIQVELMDQSMSSGDAEFTILLDQQKGWRIDSIRVYD